MSAGSPIGRRTMAGCAAALVFAAPLYAADSTPAPQTGILEKPCAALEPLPPALADYQQRVARGEPVGPPTPQMLQAYQEWNTRRLAQDFGGLCHYEDANAALAPATAQRVIFFGDSITELWSPKDPELFAGDVLNRGVGGQTTSQMVIRFQADVIALKPRVVHILAGTNDIAGNTGPTSLRHVEDNFETLVELAKAHHIRVVLASVLPVSQYSWQPSVPAVPNITALNSWLRALADREHLVYADYYSAMANPEHGMKEGLSGDGVHPTAAGYAVMRPIAQHALAEALRDK